MDDSPSELIRRNRELRKEIDRLRLENQTLRIELERLTYLRRMVRRTLGLTRSEIRDQLTRLRKKFFHQAADTVPPQEALDTSFRPYQVRTLYPAETRRRRVLHAIANFWTGGSARLVVDLIEHLGHRYEQEVIARDLPGRPAYSGLQLHHYELVKSPQPILTLLRAYRPDLVHVHYVAHHKNKYSELDWKWYSNVFQAVEEYGCKIVENVNIAVDPYVSRAVECYVYVSGYVEREFGYDGAHNVVVHPGSDMKLFCRGGTAVPENCVGMVYRLEKDKLDEHSIDPLIKVVQRRRNTTALVVGGGRYYSAFRAAAEAAGVADAFTFTGYAAYDDLPELYRRMSVFVAPVHSESFGQVVPFAMGMGIPAVGYDAGALPELIEPRSLLAPQGDSNRLAEIVIELLNDRQTRLSIGAANRRRAEQLFSIETMIARYSDIYDAVVALKDLDTTSSFRQARTGSRAAN